MKRHDSIVIKKMITYCDQIDEMMNRFGADGSGTRIKPCSGVIHDFLHVQNRRKKTRPVQNHRACLSMLRVAWRCTRRTALC